METPFDRGHHAHIVSSGDRDTRISVAPIKGAKLVENVSIVESDTIITSPTQTTTLRRSTMKMLLGILVFLLFADGVTGFKLALDDQKYLVTTVNKMRKDAAEKWRIGNMHELTWDEEIVTKIKGLPNQCDKITVGPNYRFVLVNPDESVMTAMNARFEKSLNDSPAEEKRRIKMLWDTVKANNIDELFTNLPLAFEVLKMTAEVQSRATFFLYELINPTQTKIACVSQSCSKYGGKFEGICLLGLVNSWQESNFVLDKAAGSACPTGTTAVDELCRTSSSSQQFTVLFLVISLFISSF
ncbi:unnamed protein product [Caenorhabditis sp. 36 PRJEB53466]|nr:unnamed protein product [Caenorhabditis sp. 36 PRJEB53466]